MTQGCKCEKRYADLEDMGPLEAILGRHGKEKGALIPLLQETQEAYGYLDPKLMRAIAQGAGYQLSQVYGVATFYAQFRLEPIGENLIRICHGTACHVGGATQITDEACNVLGLGHGGGTTEDMKFTLETVMCVGACSLAPIMMVNDDTHGRLKPANVRKILKRYGSEEESTDSSEE